MSAPANRKPISMPIVIAFGLVACLLYGVGGGLRTDVGILLQPLANQCGLEYADVSLCIADIAVAYLPFRP